MVLPAYARLMLEEEAPLAGTVATRLCVCAYARPTRYPVLTQHVVPVSMDNVALEIRKVAAGADGMVELQVNETQAATLFRCAPPAYAVHMPSPVLA
eukprot:3581788-Rhodomonas_salina.2